MKKDCESFIDFILESEEETLLDYLLSYCDNPLATASQDLIDLFAKYGICTSRDILSALEDGCIDAHFNYCIPSMECASIYLDVAEIEVMSEDVPDCCKDDFTFNGDYAYYYIGYGLTVLFDIDKVEKSIIEYANKPLPTLYTCVYYHDVWRDVDGWTVNNLSRLEENVKIDDDMSERDIFRLFADIVGLNKRLRAIQVDKWNYDFIEIWYTANNDMYPLGRFELN